MEKIVRLALVAMVGLFTVQCQKLETKTSEKKVSQNVSKGEKNNNEIKYTTHEIKVEGDVLHPLVLNVDSLKSMEVKEMKDLKIVCQSGITKQQIKTSKGVLLTDILDKAEIAQNNHKDRNFMIVARASDDYKASFSWAELYNTPIGQEVYVLFEENGKPLTETGEMILVSMKDIKTGPRYVRWLKSIEVSKIK